jgi:hypothetical protein
MEEGMTSRFYGLEPGSQGQNLSLSVLYVPYSLDSGKGCLVSGVLDGAHPEGVFVRTLDSCVPLSSELGTYKTVKARF